MNPSPASPPVLTLPSLAISSFISVCRIIEDSLVRNRSYYCSGWKGCGKTHTLYHFYHHPHVCVFNASLLNRNNFPIYLVSRTGTSTLYEALQWYRRRNVAIVIDDAGKTDHDCIPLFRTLLEEGVSVVLVDTEAVERLICASSSLSRILEYRRIEGITTGDVIKTLKSVFEHVPPEVFESIARFSIPSMRRLVTLLKCMDEVMKEYCSRELSLQISEKAQKRVLEYAFSV